MERLVAEVDVIVVVGGPDSNNSRKLAELARSLGRPAYLVAGPSELRREWFAGCNVVGLTAGSAALLQRRARRPSSVRDEWPGRTAVLRTTDRVAWC